MRQKTPLSRKFWLALTLFGLMGQVAWVVENMYLNVFIYEMFNASPEDISFMVAASTVTATLTTVLIGALSDRIGKRKIFISAGYILWGLSILCFALLCTDRIDPITAMTTNVTAVLVSFTVILDCIMTFFGSSANDAAFNAWLTDSTDDSNRGSAEGINAMMPLVAILVVFGGFIPLDGMDKYTRWPLIFTIIGIAVIAVGVVGFFVIEDKNTKKSETGYFKNVIYGFRPSTVKSNPSFYIYLALFIVFNISIQIFMPYLIIYYDKSLALGGSYVFIMAPAVIVAAVATALWGRVYDKKGFGFSGAFALVWLAVGFIILYLFTNTALVFIGSLLMMCGYLSGMAVFGAKIRDLTPQGKAGMLQGVRIFSQVLVPGVVGPYIGALVLANADKIVNGDGTESFLPNSNIFLAALIPIVTLSVFLAIYGGRKKPRTVNLTTPFEDKETQSTTWDEYPRPQMKRDSYLSLSGEWELSVKNKNGNTSLGHITVPFPPESRISGIERFLEKGEKYIYTKTFSTSDTLLGERFILHFGAADQIARVTLNGKYLGEHTGGYLPFSFDVTDSLIKGENTLTVEIEDDLDRDLAWGKQRHDRGGMWYTPISGLWKQVWLEGVPEDHITRIKITPCLNSVKIEVYGGKNNKMITYIDGETEKCVEFSGDTVTLSPETVINWTPDKPYLYNFTLTDGCDKIESYFALRTVSIEKRGDFSYISLNGEPIFCHGLLDQGYYPDGIYTPASPDGLLYDIQKMKSLGFNMLRKHIKIEHELFYYYCDKYGMLVFQDMVNSGNYSFSLDTALPTIGKKRGITHKATEKRRHHFEKDSRETIDLLYNHPSVIYYTVFNEGWGQYDADRIYGDLKEYDPTRIYDATSGWFFEIYSDVTSDHIYFKPITEKNLCHDSSRPCVLSEFGGYSCKIEEHSFNLDKTYGYSTCKTVEAFEISFLKLYREEVIPAISRGLCATVYTQVSDVEDETNGLLTYDRKICKLSEETMLDLSKELDEAFKLAVK